MNKDTLQAIQDARNGIGLSKEFHSVSELMEDLNSETVDVLLEAERIAKDPSVKGYTDVDELFAPSPLI